MQCIYSEKPKKWVHHNSAAAAFESIAIIVFFNMGKDAKTNVLIPRRPISSAACDGEGSNSTAQIMPADRAAQDIADFDPLFLKIAEAELDLDTG